MCLLAVAFRVHAEYPLVLIGNRDEFHSRPSSPAHWWRSSAVLAGQDLLGGGTWLGLTRSGRIATVTNYRDPGKQRNDVLSRGALVLDALNTEATCFHESLQQNGHRYNGFNLLWGDGRQLHYAHNQAVAAADTRLEPGVYGLSNGFLDTPWPKLVRVREGLKRMMDADGPLMSDALFHVLSDEQRPPEQDLPNTGVSREWETLLSSPFIRSQEYGTRASSVVIMHRNGVVTFQERSFAPDGQVTADRRFRFKASSGS